MLNYLDKLYTAELGIVQIRGNLFFDTDDVAAWCKDKISSDYADIIKERKKLVCKCTSEIEAFRYHFLDGNIVLFDKIDTAFTYLNKDTELFKAVNVPMQDTMKEYVELAAQTAEEQKEYFTGPLGNDVFQCSPMP